MSEDSQKVSVKHTIKIEKRNDDGELFETVELTADGDNQVTSAKITHRREGLAPDAAYAPIDVEPGSS